MLVPEKLLIQLVIVILMLKCNNTKERHQRQPTLTKCYSFTRENTPSSFQIQHINVNALKLKLAICHIRSHLMTHLI